MLPETDLTPVIALVLAVFVIGLEQMVQWRYGAMGVFGLTLVGVGVKARNTTCVSVGLLVLALLLAP